jgi:hypothetical protein
VLLRVLTLRARPVLKSVLGRMGEWLGSVKDRVVNMFPHEV